MLLLEIKSQANTLNFVFLLAFISYVLYRLGKIRTAKILAFAGISLFFVASTGFFPVFVAQRLESQYPSFDVDHFKRKPGVLLVHVLGGGRSADKNAPPNTQLGLETLGRLAEGLRIVNSLSGSMLITSGCAPEGLESQASVAKRAAMAMGLDSARITTLDKPETTKEEAEALAKKFGYDISLIIVTDAIHMPRAMRIFRSAGLDPFPAPTNYVARGSTKVYLSWIPSIKNILLTDRLLHEFFGTIKAKFL